jgi:hypothetical protein
MLSNLPTLTAAQRFFEDQVCAGIDMSRWTKIRTSPATLTPQDCVLLAHHCGVELGYLFSRGIGVANRISDFEGIAEISPRGTIELAARAV